MEIKDKIIGDIVRFYVTPEGEFSFANIKKVFDAKPYSGMLSQLEDILSVRETTDINYDSSFNYSISDGIVELFLMVSMIGKYAVIFSTMKDIFEENYQNSYYLFNLLSKQLLANDVALVNGPVLKSKFRPMQTDYNKLFKKSLFYYLFERD